MASVVNLAMRGLQFLWTLLIMAIAGNMVAVSSANAVVNFALFVSVFAMLSLFYLIPASFKDSLAIHPIIDIVLDGLNVLFFFCGGVALAAELGAHSCSNAQYTKHNGITNKGSDHGSRCREGQATTAFLWFGLVAFAVSAVMSGLGSKGRK